MSKRFHAPMVAPLFVETSTTQSYPTAAVFGVAAGLVALEGKLTTLVDFSDRYMIVPRSVGRFSCKSALKPTAVGYVFKVWPRMSTSLNPVVLAMIRLPSGSCRRSWPELRVLYQTTSPLLLRIVR